MKTLLRAIRYRTGLCVLACLPFVIIPWIPINPLFRALLALPFIFAVVWILEWRDDFITDANDIKVPDGVTLLSIPPCKDLHQMTHAFEQTAGAMITPDMRVYCVCGLSSASGKSTMSVSLVCRLQKDGRDTVLVNADFARSYPTDYNLMAKGQAQSIRKIGPIDKENPKAALKSILDEEKGSVVIDYGPFRAEEIGRIDIGVPVVLVLLIRSRKVTRRAVADFWEKARLYSQKAYFVFNAGAKPDNEYECGYYEEFQEK